MLGKNIFALKYLDRQAWTQILQNMGSAQGLQSLPLFKQYLDTSIGSSMGVV